ncbi:MAG: TlpA family protein disulfide reductase [Acidobacteriota bacterium]|nr:TlpA family protein disulfide reductase [Acidobacteriota bacterium]
MSSDGVGRPGRSRLFGLILFVMLAVMAVEIVLLIGQNRELKATVGALREQMALGQQAIPSLEEGEVLGPLVATALDGSPATVSYDDLNEDTILLVFSPSCPACNENMANWQKLEDRYPSEDKRLFYVSTAGADETLEFVAAYGIAAPVLLPDDFTMTEYKITHIPTTLVVGPGGAVKEVIVGVLSEKAVAEL